MSTKKCKVQFPYLETCRVREWGKEKGKEGAQ
jgi:hypothetical protein